MRSRKQMLPGLCKHKSSPLKKTDDTLYQGGMLNEVKLTDKYPSRKARRRGEERKLRQELHSNPVIKAIHNKTSRAAKNITKGFEHAAIITPVGGAARGAKGTKKIFDTFNKIAQNRKAQSKLIEESLKKKGWKILPSKTTHGK
jgi:hypothetical protein